MAHVLVQAQGLVLVDPCNSSHVSDKPAFSKFGTFFGRLIFLPAEYTEGRFHVEPASRSKLHFSRPQPGGHCQGRQLGGSRILLFVGSVPHRDARGKNRGSDNFS